MKPVNPYAILKQACFNTFESFLKYKPTGISLPIPSTHIYEANIRILSIKSTIQFTTLSKISKMSTLAYPRFTMSKKRRTLVGSD